MRSPLIVFLIGCSVLLAAAACAQTSDDHSGPVMNYHRVDDRLVTGGHLVGGGLERLAQQGVQVVIDLRDEPPEGEATRYKEQGIEWLNVPVEWRNPTHENFARFKELMNNHKDDHVLVQCQANYRASAMTYLYRVTVEGVDEEVAAKDLRAVWNPAEYETWDAYIKEITQAAAE